ncbi:MAG: hypothetical protein AB1643_01585 [Patescibacteria group bacterium]
MDDQEKTKEVLILEPIEWKAPEYEFYKKTKDWYWTLMLISFALLALSFVFKNILMGILTIIGSFALILFSVRKPRIISFSLMSRGIRMDDKIYNYENLKGFWIDYDPPHKKFLLLESKKIFVPQLKIFLNDADPVKIRAYLLKFVKEEKLEESLMSAIARILKI